MRIGIFGYGNLGHGVEFAARQNGDIELIGVFTRRNPDGIVSSTGAKVFSAEKLIEFRNVIDVLIVCAGSATELPVLSPKLAKHFNIVDSFDTHADIPLHFTQTDKAARDSGHLALIACGWDPGLFSLARLYTDALLPGGNIHTFWGPGVSQGHSDAVRHIDGVLDARQYTVPLAEAIDDALSGKPSLPSELTHRRECYVVAKEGADLDAIESQIKNMPAYFADYDTTVTFIDASELQCTHSEFSHGGRVIGSSVVGKHRHTLEFSLTLDSNPEFTGSVLIAYARAVDRMAKRGDRGCVTVFDIPPSLISPLSPDGMRKAFM